MLGGFAEIRGGCRFGIGSACGIYGSCSNFRIFEHQAAPVPRSTAGTVRARIFRSSHKDHLSMYCMSSSIHCSNGMEFLPLTCHRHVIPGLTLKRRLCQSLSKSL